MPQNPAEAGIYARYHLRGNHLDGYTLSHCKGPLEHEPTAWVLDFYNRQINDMTVVEITNRGPSRSN